MGRLDVVPHIAVVDPAVHSPELCSFNWMSSRSDLALTYHLPALFGFKSFPKDMKALKGVIVLGSASSVNDDLDWQRSLKDWLFKVIEHEIPVLGICFGHQLIAHMYGANIAYLFPDQRKLTGFRRVKLAFDDFKIKKELELFSSHNQHVTDIPKGFVVAGQTPDVAIEALKHKKKPIFTVQTHPEASETFIESRKTPEQQHLGSLADGRMFIDRFLEFVSKIHVSQG